ncbi:MAG: hypothetical protein GX905_06710, partial [Bacteroidales bacterium]|nr:hypothetical protein [Bacteroidales bacterium]
YNKLTEGIEQIKERNESLLCYYFLITLCLIRLEKHDEASKYCAIGLQVHKELSDKNIGEQWIAVPTMKQFEDLMNKCREKTYSPTEIHIQYTRQLLTSLNPFLWKEKGYSLLTAIETSFNELYETKPISTDKKGSEIQNQLEKIHFKILLENERILAETTEDSEIEDSHAAFFKTILENNPSLVAIWKKEMKNIIQNN